MLRFCLVAVLSFITAAAVAQSSFVEVTVDDTLQLEPEEVIYIVSQVNYFTADSIAVSTMDPAPVVEQPDGLKEVRKVIAAMRLDTLPPPHNYTISNSPYDARGNFIRVRFTSLAKLRDFVSRLQKMGGITGVVADHSSSKEDQAERLLSQRLFEKAKAKGAVLAQITGKKLGSLLSVKEVNVQGGWTMYPPLSSIPGWHTTIEGQQTEYIVLFKAMVFQFQWQ